VQVQAHSAWQRALQTREYGLEKLQEKKCKPCEGGTSPLPADRVALYRSQVPGWEVSTDGKSISRNFTFKGFFRTMSFINALAWIANQQGHHPDFSAGYNYCNVTFTTHAIDGLSENDFICASRVNTLLES
jgi:4a-hydroxytetrahydrobiopterin dehydratase